MEARKSKRQRLIADSIEADEVQINLKSMVASLEKQLSKNQQLRLKYADQPEKFMTSEVDLHETVTKFHSIAADPAEFAAFIELGAVPTLLGLLQHENQDISMAVVHLLSELTDPDALVHQSDKEAAKKLIDALVSHHALELVVTHLLQIPEERSDVEAQAVYDTLEMIENMTDLDISVCEKLIQRTRLPHFLLTRVNAKTFDANKLYASEILSIVYQADMDSCEQLSAIKVDSKIDGLDILLQSIAKYRKKDPASTDEQECVENLFNTLALSLLYMVNQDHFRHLQGFELMIKCMKDKNYVADCVLRVIDHSLTNNIRNCERFIQLGGLKYLFGVFMGRIGLSKAGRKAGKHAQEQEDRCVSILSTLALLCPRDAADNAYERLHAKFVDKNFEKCDRAIEIYERHVQIFNQLDDRLRIETEKLEKAGELETDEDREEWELEMQSRRQDAGVNTYHRICFVIVHVASVLKDIKQYILGKLHEQDFSEKAVVAVVEDYSITLKREATTETDQLIESQRQRLAELCKLFLS